MALCVNSDVDPRVVTRLRYSLRLVADALGLRVSESSDADVSIGYGVDADLELPLGLSVRPKEQAAPTPTMIAGVTGEQLPQFHQTTSGQLDHLSELFEWASGLHEHSVTIRDDVGRVPSDQSLPVHAGLDPTVAWGSRIIDDLGSRLVAVKPGLGSAMPQPDVPPTVAVSHDLDFYCRDSGDVVRRLARSVLAAARRGDSSTVRRTLAKAVRQPHRMARILDTVDDLVALDQSHGVEASWVIIPRRAHRRDANYELADLHHLLSMLDGVADLAVHGSYTSLETPGGLAEEYAAMRTAGFDVSGGRQHWLRFSNHDLFDALELAGATWDSSVGFSDRVGFRHGMASPYRMWNPETEQPLPTLQIPLVMMDMALDAMHRGGQSWMEPAQQVLAELERSPGAGASVLWHDTVFSGIQTDPEIVDFYHSIVSRPYRWRSLSAIAAECGSA